jgi:hypothetical protein
LRSACSTFKPSCSSFSLPDFVHCAFGGKFLIQRPIVSASHFLTLCVAAEAMGDVSQYFADILEELNISVLFNPSSNAFDISPIDPIHRTEAVSRGLWLALSRSMIRLRPARRRGQCSMRLAIKTHLAKQLMTSRFTFVIK